MSKDLYRTTLHTIENAHDRTIKAGSNYTMLFISRGSCYATLEDAPAFCGTEDMILLKPKTATTLHNRNSRFPLEYFEISVSPKYLDELSDLEINFQGALDFIPDRILLSHLDSKSAMLIKNIALQIISVCTSNPHFGHKLFIKNLYSMLILLTIRACIESDVIIRKHRTKKLVIDDIFGYISEHLTEDLSLEKLESEFFVSKYYICREFKRLTGLSPHAYIVKTRLNACCNYIEQGLPINEVYQLGGFAGYNHFFRAFKKEYHMTPKEYYANYSTTSSNLPL